LTVKRVVATLGQHVQLDGQFVEMTVPDNVPATYMYTQLMSVISLSHMRCLLQCLHGVV